MDKPCLWARAARTGKAERGGRVSAGLKMAPALVGGVLAFITHLLLFLMRLRTI